MSNNSDSKNNIYQLIRPHLLEIKTYDPVQPPEMLAKQAGIAEENVIKLNGNENPFGCSQEALDAISKTPFHVYPDPLQYNMRNTIADYANTNIDNVIVGAGSDELIDLLFRLFVSPGDSIIDSDPTFGMYGFCARVAGAETIMVPRNENFDINIDEINKAALNPKAKIIFVSSPNNPTGNIVSESEVRDLLETGLLVVIDEAYYEFANSTVSNLIQEYENLVILRTMSKWAGLAGLRIGYGIMSKRLVKHLIDIKPPYSVNVAAEAALIASLHDAETLIERVSKIIEERNRMFGMINNIPGIKAWPSFGNFILCGFNSGMAKKVYDGLCNKGIFVRRFGTDRLKDTFRITVGNSSETDTAIKAIRSLMAQLS